MKYDASDEDLIDVIEGNRIYIPAIYVMNKIDQISLEELELLNRVPHYCPISGYCEWNLDGLLEMIWDYLDMIRLYTKPKGQNPDYDDPVIINRERANIEYFCNKIHKAILNQLKYALVWGTSVKHKPQKVGKEHTLQDEDVIQLVKKV